MTEETAKSIAQSLERIAEALETLATSVDNELGIPVALYQSDEEKPIRVAVSGSVETQAND